MLDHRGYGHVLYHVSENPDIRVFEPRPSPSSQPLLGDTPVVWALDADHLAHYLFPRDCPRLVWWADGQTSSQDRRELCPVPGKYAAVESGWYQRIRDARLYIYSFEPQGFELIDAIAGYHVCRTALCPGAVEEAGDLLGQLCRDFVELRLLQDLWELRERLIHSTVQFSLIRMRNAQSPSASADRFTPLP